MKKVINIYLGCDLFKEGERIQASFVENELKSLLGDKVEIYNPAKNETINDKDSGFASGALILVEDYMMLKDSDLLIALFDTQDVGLAAEMGIAFERNIPIFQLHTDIRLGGNQNQEKLQGLYNDIFQNDFFYINKLVTALSYIELHNNAKGVKVLEKPRVYRNRKDLIYSVCEYVNNKLEGQDKNE